MKMDKMLLLSDPPKFHYICPKCGYEEMLVEAFPKTIYKRVGIND